MADTAFNARFRLMENKKRTNDRSPEQNIAVDFTPEQAMAAAAWLQTAAEQCLNSGTTVRQYRGKDDFTEVPGFTLWGGIWGTSGSFAPLAHENTAAEPLF